MAKIAIHFQLRELARGLDEPWIDARVSFDELAQREVLADIEQELHDRRHQQQLAPTRAARAHDLSATAWHRG